MKGILLVFAAALGAVAFLPRSGRADGVPACGVPAKSPVWIDYAGHDAPITPKPGLVLAVSSGTVIPGQMRAAGAATIFFDNIKLINILAPLTGDFDRNGVVDSADYVLWRQTLGTADSRADANFNGVVDAADYQLWRANFGSTSTSNGASLDFAQVPEPTTGVLLIFACTFAIVLSRVSPRFRRGFPRALGCHALAAAAA